MEASPNPHEVFLVSKRKVADILVDQVCVYQESGNADDREMANQVSLLIEKLRTETFTQADLGKMLTQCEWELDDTEEDQERFERQQEIRAKLDAAPRAVELAHLIASGVYLDRSAIRDDFVEQLATADSSTIAWHDDLALGSLRTNAENNLIVQASDDGIPQSVQEALYGAIPYLEQILHGRVAHEWSVMGTYALEEQPTDQLANRIIDALRYLRTEYQEHSDDGDPIEDPRSRIINEFIDVIEKRELMTNLDRKQLIDWIDELIENDNSAAAAVRYRVHTAAIIDPLDEYCKRVDPQLKVDQSE